MGGGAPQYEDIQEVSRKRLKDTRLRLDFATNYLREVQRDFRDGAVPSADGNFAYQKALRAEHVALGDYRRILRIFNDLVMYGKVPEESEWRHHKTAGPDGEGESQ